MRYVRKFGWIYGAVLVLAAALSLTVSKGVSFAAKLAEAAIPVRPVVIIDPGHGREDGGALSCTGIKESDLNLEISLRLRDLLLLLGQPVTMTRDADVSTADPGLETISEKKVSDLRNRVAFVNDAPGAILVSIHQNTFPQAKYSGAQVFYAQTEGSEALAASVQANLRDALDPENRRECKLSQTVYLLNKIRCPGILIECGFLSNPNEEYRLRQTAYQRKLVCAAAGAITEYLAHRDKA